MGREIKRVPLDFNWPLHKVWQGYKNPFYTAKECHSCNGSGYSPYAKNLQDLWYGQVPFDPASTGSKPFGINHPFIRALAERNVSECIKLKYNIGSVEQEAERLATTCFDNHWGHHLSQDDVDALIKEDRLYELTKTWVPQVGWKPKEPKPEISAAMVNEWSLSGMGHDSINCSVCIGNRCEREGQEKYCSECHGEGIIWPSKEDEKRYDEWEGTEPPSGEAYQLWETVSEGSPVSPPFMTPEELAAWLRANDTSVTKDTSFEEWVKFIRGPGWSVSAVTMNGEVMSGVKHAATF